MTVTGEPLVSASNYTQVHWARVLRALVLFVAGMAITFTQSLHNNLLFNAWVFAAFAIVHGLVLFATLTRTATLHHQPGALALASVSLVAGLVAIFMQSTAALATVILVWAAATALIEFWPWVRSRQRDALMLGALAGLLAVILALGARELPAVIGFFGAYCIITGVYLGIASFDTNSHEDGITSRESTEA